MKSILGPIIKAVSDALLASSAVTSAVGADRVFVASPPTEIAPPYVVVADVDGVPRRVLGGGRAYHEGQVVIEAYGDGSSPIVVLTAADAIVAALDDATLAITGFDNVFVHLTQERRDPLQPGEHRTVVPFAFMVREAAS